ncbi:hypothetical protein BgAZ_101310 [Babesia gibsoni]|uniref:Exocyst complex component Sec3 C-terminal domain-containing protein n=1 Tax=Babesia gibsoni TaxID=33632 RepID=A0AAD8PF34_BABGI|nr:hypothetical protein BgAZ_101310 [Babesia gibsoni]
MVSPCSFTTIYMVVLLTPMCSFESTVATKPRELWKSAPDVSGNPQTPAPEVALSYPDDLWNATSSDTAIISNCLRRYDSFSEKCSELYLLLDDVINISSPEESYFDVKILSTLVERRENANSGFVSNVWNNTYDRMTHNLEMLEDLGAELQRITGSTERKKVCRSTASGDEFVTRIDNMDATYEKSFAAAVDQFVKDGGLNIQRNMLKCLSMSMLNDLEINRLLKVLTAEHVRATEKRNLVLSKRGFYDMVQRVDMDIIEFQKWVKPLRNILKVYAKRIERVAILFTSAKPKGLVLRHFRQSEKCASLWYKMYRGMQEMKNVVLRTRNISGNVKYTIFKNSQCPNIVRLYGKVIKVVLDALPYRLDNREVKNQVRKSIGQLCDCLHKLESNENSDGFNTRVKLDVADVVKVTSGFHIRGEPELILSVGYLLVLCRNMEIINYEIRNWITVIGQLQPTSASPGTSDCGPTIFRTRMIVKSITNLMNDVRYAFRDLKHGNCRHIGKGAEAQGKSSRVADVTQLRDRMDQIYMKLYSARLLLMEFYDMIFSMRGVVNIKLRLFQEYDIVDEARTIIKMALTALEEHFGHYTNFKEQAMSYLKKHPPMEGSREDVTGSASNSIKQEGKVKREDIELIVHQLNWPDNIVSLVRELDSIFNALHSGSPLNDVEEALALFFGMRTMLHKALLLEKSIDVIKHLGSRIVEGMNGHGETGKR